METMEQQVMGPYVIEVFESFVGAFYTNLYNFLVDEMQYAPFCEALLAAQAELKIQLNEQLTPLFTVDVQQMASIDRLHYLKDAYVHIAHRCADFQRDVSELLQLYFPDKYPDYFYATYKLNSALQKEVEQLSVQMEEQAKLQIILKQEIDVRKENEQQLKTTIDELTEENVELDERVIILMEEHVDLTDQVVAFKEQVEELKNEVDELSEEKLQLQSHADTLVREHAKLNEHIDLLIEKETALKERGAELTKNNVELKKTQADLGSEVEELVNEKVQLKEHAEMLTEEKAALQNEVAALGKDKVQQLQAKAETLQQTADSENIEHYEQQITALQATNEHLTQQVDNLFRENSDLLSRQKLEEAMSNHSNQKMKMLKEEYEQQEAELQQVVAQRDTYKKNLEALQREVSDQQQKVQQFAKLYKEQLQSNKAMEQLKAENEKLQQQKSEILNFIDNMPKVSSGSTSKELALLKEEVEQRREDEYKLRREIKELNLKIVTMEKAELFNGADGDSPWKTRYEQLMKRYEADTSKLKNEFIALRNKLKK